MSSVHYKFKATLEYKTLTFDGLHIGVDELKKAICDKENIRTESFDLLITNAHTKREYTTGELVPRNSSVVVQRLPRDNALKLPKVQDTTNSGIVQRSAGVFQSSTYISPDDFSKLSEEQRIAHVKQVSAEKYSAANYQKRPIGIMSGPPPPTYVCNRCAQPGHWYKSCPLVNTKRTTGIPMDELMETTKDDPLAMLHPSGKFVKSIMHFQARLQRKHEPFPGQADDVTGSPSIEEQSEVPEQYKCYLCKGLLRDAVLAACCGHSFCAECYQQQLLANPLERCPGPECSQQISADSLIPNKSLRSAIQKYLNELHSGGETTDQQTGGVNKPSVLTDTQSLLHKLMPDLAFAQAQRELATTAGRSPPQPDSSQTSSVATTNMPAASITQPVPSKPPPIFIGLKTISDPMTSTTTTINVTTQNNAVYDYSVTALSSQAPSQAAPLNNITTVSTESSLHGAPLFLPKIPIFDPKMPPPPINIPPSAAQNIPLTPPIMTTGNGSAMHVPTSINPVQQKGLVNASSLSAQELSSLWENFLIRKDKEKKDKRTRPSPTINIPISAAQNVPVAPIVSLSPPGNGSVRHVTTSINTIQPKVVTASPLSAQELTSVWENFLKRKDKEKNEEKMDRKEDRNGKREVKDEKREDRKDKKEDKNYKKDERRDKKEERYEKKDEKKHRKEEKHENKEEKRHKREEKTYKKEEKKDKKEENNEKKEEKNEKKEERNEKEEKNEKKEWIEEKKEEFKEKREEIEEKNDEKYNKGEKKERKEEKKDKNEDGNEHKIEKKEENEDKIVENKEEKQENKVEMKEKREESEVKKRTKDDDEGSKKKRKKSEESEVKERKKDDDEGSKKRKKKSKKKKKEREEAKKDGDEKKKRKKEKGSKKKNRKSSRDEHEGGRKKDKGGRKKEKKDDDERRKKKRRKKEERKEKKEKKDKERGRKRKEHSKNKEDEGNAKKVKL